MNLYLKQHVFTWGDRFSIYDIDGNSVFSVESEVFTFGKKLHVFDFNGNEVAFIRQKLFNFMPNYSVMIHGENYCEVQKHFTFFSRKYYVDGPDITVSGDFTAHEYTAEKDGKTVFNVSKRWFTFVDAYEININDIDPLVALCIVLIVDACDSDN